MLKSFILLCLVFIYHTTIFASLNFTDNTEKELTNKVKSPIIFNEEIIDDKYFVDTNASTSYLTMEGNDILSSSGLIVSDVNIIPDYQTPAFRYAEVTFIISTVFAFTYASLASFGLDTIENNFIINAPARNPYRQVKIASTTFQVVTGLACATAIAYDSYQRLYGKKKNKLSFTLVPFYEPKNNNGGFMFALSYPLKTKY